MGFEIEMAFRSCDQSFSGYVTFTDVSLVLYLNLLFLSSKTSWSNTVCTHQARTCNF